MKLLQSHLGRLRIVAFLEGLSFVLLVGIAMPMKYYMGMESATQDLGMAHGVLFMAYVYLVWPVRNELNWSWKTTLWVWVASIIPLGTFVAEYKLFRKA